jgi:hypothetical protein
MLNDWWSQHGTIQRNEVDEPQPSVHSTPRIIALVESSMREPEPLQFIDLTGQITLTDKYPSGHGGFANVWKGVWQSESGSRKVLRYTCVPGDNFNTAIPGSCQSSARYDW